MLSTDEYQIAERLQRWNPGHMCRRREEPKDKTKLGDSRTSCPKLVRRARWKTIIAAISRPLPQQEIANEIGSGGAGYHTQKLTPNNGENSTPNNWESNTVG